MNYKSANLEICKSIIQDQRVACQRVDDDTLLVIPNNGVYGYFIQIDDCAFNFDKLCEIDIAKKQIADLSVIQPKNQITPTDDFKLMNSRKNDFIRKFAGQIKKNGKKENKTVWVNASFLKPLNMSVCEFYQDKSDVSPIIAVEEGKPVMLFMPVKINW